MPQRQKGECESGAVGAQRQCHIVIVGVPHCSFTDRLSLFVVGLCGPATTRGTNGSSSANQPWGKGYQLINGYPT